MGKNIGVTKYQIKPHRPQEGLQQPSEINERKEMKENKIKIQFLFRFKFKIQNLRVQQNEYIPTYMGLKNLKAARTQEGKKEASGK